MSRVDVTLQISPEVVALADTVQRNLVDKIIPRGVIKVVPVVRAAIIRHLPDGRASGTRAKQSEKSETRFPHAMKSRVRVKTVRDPAGVLKIIGVDRKAGHVNFDHGEKAKSRGRLHKLWAVKGKEVRFATPKLRKQTQDIPRIVESEVGAQVLNTVEEEVRRAVQSGELT